MSGGIAVRANLLCVTDTGAQGRVLLFDLEARALLSRWTLPRTGTGYSDAAGVAMDDRFHIFVADPQAGRVRHYSVFGVHLGDLGQPPEPGDASRDRPGVLDHPSAVAVLDDLVLVTSGDRRLRRGVQCFGRDGTVGRPLRPEGDPEGWFGAPRGLWADRTGILVADTLHGRVQRFRPDGGFVASFATAAEPGEVSRPHGLARLQDGTVVVIDAGDRPGLRWFAAGGRVLPAPPGRERVEGPVAVAVDERDRLYVLDRGGVRVLRCGADREPEAEPLDLSEHLDGL